MRVVQRTGAFLACLVMVIGCGGGGTSTGDSPEEQRKALVGDTALLYLYTSGQEGIADDGVLTQDEVDCNNYLFQPTPLPEGRIYEGHVTHGDDYWDCPIGIEKYNADGTFSLRVIDELVEEYAGFWEVCQEESFPRTMHGSWIVAPVPESYLEGIDPELAERFRASGVFCWNLPLMPGMNFCGANELSADGQTNESFGNVLMMRDGMVVFDFPSEVNEACRLVSPSGQGGNQ